LNIKENPSDLKSGDFGGRSVGSSYAFVLAELFLCQEILALSAERKVYRRRKIEVPHSLLH
jgi:hypothetical protein